MPTSENCLCGAVTFECDELGAASYCHCEDCRRLTGSAFNVGVRCPTDRFRITSGELGSFTKKGRSGFDLTRWFCSSCGSPIYGSSPVDSTLVYVRAGALNDPRVVKAKAQYWTRSKVDWADIPANIPTFEKGRELEI